MARTRKTHDEQTAKTENVRKNAKRDDTTAVRKEGETAEPRAPYGKTFPEELPNEDVRDRQKHDDRRNDGGKF